MDAFLLFNIFIVICLFLITGVWCYVFLLWARSISHSPKLIEEYSQTLNQQPNVSIILPARNEEKYIKKCIESLLDQDYPNFELIVVNDGSNDKTLDIVKEIPDKEHRLKVIDLQYKPDKWVGKNWACYKGYLESIGEILLFTDADTYHTKNTLSLCIMYFIKNNLDALNLLPRTIGINLFTRLLLPLYTLHQHTFCSPVSVNDPNSKKKDIYFLGTYYLIKRETYEKIGTHSAVRDKFIEDLVIGRKLRELKFKMNMIRGEFNLYTETIRTSNYLFNQISRVIGAYYQENKLGAIKVTLFLFAVYFLPPFLLLYSIIINQVAYPNLFPEVISLVLSLITISIIVMISSLQLRFGLYQNPWYGLGGPFGAYLFSYAYIVELMKAIGKTPLAWKQRIT